MSKISFWTDNEVLKLFRTVEEHKKTGSSLTSAFALHAKNFDRKNNSVRNYYYFELAEMQKDKNRATKLDIDLSKHVVCQFEKFSKQQENDLIAKINNLISQGNSVRKACLILANNDIKKMLRIQNKYTTLSKNNKNIIQMPIKKTYLSDNEINSLFLGLVKMVKKNADLDARNKIKKEIDIANESLRQTLVCLLQRENEIKVMRAKFKVIEEQRQKMKIELNNLKCETANLIVGAKQKQKMQRLEQYFMDKAEKIAKV